MNDNENDFEALRRLLALKRYEAPPPGYFDRFSGEVMARLRASQSKSQDGAADPLSDGVPWLVRIIRALESKPAFAATFASALCLLLLAGITFAEQPEGAIQPLMQSAQEVSPLNIASASAASTASEHMTVPTGFSPGADPVYNPRPGDGLATAGLFGSQGVSIQPAIFTFPGN
jgi:hypothetical protein